MTDQARADEVVTLIAAGRDREAAHEGARATNASVTVTSLDPNGEPPMDVLTQFDRLASPLGAVVGHIRPDQLDAPTPCADLDVRGVLAHMISGATAFAAAFRGEAPGEPDLTDVLAGFEPALGALVAAIQAPGALEQTITAPFGEVPGEVFARFVVLDGLVHGWDLATATGQPYEPAADLVASVEAFARQALEPMRDGQTFGPEVAAAPHATPIQRLAALTGRRP